MWACKSNISIKSNAGMNFLQHIKSTECHAVYHFDLLLWKFLMYHFICLMEEMTLNTSSLEDLHGTQVIFHLYSYQECDIIHCPCFNTQTFLYYINIMIHKNLYSGKQTVLFL